MGVREDSVYLHNPRLVDARRTENPVQRRIRPRGVPAALESRQILYTEDICVATDLLPDILQTDHATLVATPVGDFHAVAHGVRSRDISVLYVDLAGARLSIPQLGQRYAVHMQLSGSTRWSTESGPFESTATQALVTNPGQHLHAEFGIDSTLLIISFGEQRLHRYLSLLRGRSIDEDLYFAPGFDLTTEPAARWHSAVQLLTSELFYTGSLLHQGVGIGPVEELLMSTLLYVQESNHRSALVAPGHPVGKPAVRHAIEYIESHLGEHIALGDVVEACGTSERTVQQGFREELDTTPTAYIRDRRLERVHDALADALPSDGVTVSDVAVHWGFTHLGNFASAYRGRFDESPSQTLRR